jgi:hypothetical protein
MVKILHYPGPGLPSPSGPNLNPVPIKALFVFSRELGTYDAGPTAKVFLT